jgi:hypothetical protein
MLYGFGAGTFLGAVYPGIAVAIDSIARPSSSSHPDVLSIVGGDLLLMLFAAPFGMIAGSILGLLVGAVNGIITGVLTVEEYFPVDNRSSYRVFIRNVTTITTFVASVLIGGTVLGWVLPFDRGDPGAFWIWTILVPAIIAACAAFWASGRISGWYEHEMMTADGNHVNHFE